MYSFAQRPDTRVVDEPLYAHYLRVSGARHPGREEVLAGQDSDGARVVRDLILGDFDRPVVFFKQMAHHLVDLDLSFLQETIHCLLIRDPEEMLPSLVQQIPQPRLEDTGLSRQVDLLRRLHELGQEPPVLDARELLLDPEGVLRQVCAALGIFFVEAMLTWNPGPRPEDGIWARYWYHNLHRSTTFERYVRKTTPFPERLRPLLQECRPCYDVLYQAAIRSQR